MANNFDNTTSANLIGLWDFRDGDKDDDTGVDDGHTQDGDNKGDADYHNGWLLTEGDGAFIVDEGPDSSFDLDEGTLVVSFKQSSGVDETQTVVSRGVENDPGCPGKGVFEVRITEDGAVEVIHTQGATSAHLTTGDGFADSGEVITVSYGWTPDGVVMKVVNEDTGQEIIDSADVSGLNFDLTDGNEKDESFYFGAKGQGGECWDNGFEGKIDYVAVLDENVVSVAPAGDGIVSGTSGADLIDIAYTGDPEGDMIDNGDAPEGASTPNDDVVDAGDGNDTVFAALGSDTIYGGGGADSLNGGVGNDEIYGDSAAPGTGPSGPREVFQWDLAPDPNSGGGIDDGDDLTGAFSQDTGNVIVSYSIQNQTSAVKTTFSDDAHNVSGIEDDGSAPEGDSSMQSLAREDGEAAEYQLSFSDPVEDVSFTVSDIDGDGVISITAFDPQGNQIEVNLSGGSKLDLQDNDGITGNETAVSEGGYDDAESAQYALLVEIPGPVSKIVIEHEQVGDADTGVHVSDVYFDTILPVDPGPAGDDIIDGGEGADLIYGEGGDDTILGGVGDDIFGGEDADGQDIDVLDLRGAAEAANPGGSLTVEYEVGDPEAGVVTFFDADGDVTGTATFAEIENVIPCFTPGTLIATPQGERWVEDLKAGDRVITRDNGIQVIRWAGRRDLEGAEMRGAAHLQPIMIRQGALGNNLPERDMMVSPNHRVLVANDKTALYFEDREVLVAAKHLTGLQGVDQVEATSISYIHFMFDQHEVVLSDGAWSESFQPGDQTLRGLDNAQRNEIFELFPELKTQEGRGEYAAARRSLKKHEARLLVH